MNLQVAGTTAAPKDNLFNYSPSGLEAYFSQHGEKPFRARQVMKWVYHHGVCDFDGMSNLSIKLREQLAAAAGFQPPAVLTEKLSEDGTVKWLMGLEGGNAVETVFIPEANRGTLCVSSQVGCSLNCSFCSTGAQGFNRNLSTAEIIGQVWLAAQRLGHLRHGDQRITNVVMMGMGEPLLNFDAVTAALQLMRDDLGFGLASRRVTVSTAGLVPAIAQLRDSVDVALAVSLHAPDDELRNQLVPLNRKYPIKTLMAACADYVKGRHKRHITFEYTMLDGVNDHPQQAQQLVKLLRRLPSKLNLIPFNPFPGTEYRTSAMNRIEEFQQIMQHSGIITTIRKTRGDDIDAACGQLVGQVNDRTRRSERLRIQRGLT
ncbi:MAG: 23S rRNA (adenine(2503)-C(2))-methyltransferase RlmN [Wenzhouxiangellaceae bacterium]